MKYATNKLPAALINGNILNNILIWIKLDYELNTFKEILKVNSIQVEVK